MLAPRYYVVEWKTDEGAERRKENRERGLRVVLEEQYRQRMRVGIVEDPDRIAFLYQHTASNCQAKANLVGIKDGMAAAKVVNEYDTRHSSPSVADFPSSYMDVPPRATSKESQDETTTFFASSFVTSQNALEFDIKIDTGRLLL
jgi:hypothetical protein